MQLYFSYRDQKCISDSGLEEPVPVFRLIHMFIVIMKFRILITGNYFCPLMKSICMGTLGVGHKESSLLVLLDMMLN